MQYLADNKEWIFSGVGAVVVAAALSFIGRKVFSRREESGSNNQVQRSGSHSTNTQIGSIAYDKEEKKK